MPVHRTTRRYAHTGVRITNMPTSYAPNVRVSITDDSDDIDAASVAGVSTPSNTVNPSRPSLSRVQPALESSSRNSTPASRSSTDATPTVMEKTASVDAKPMGPVKPVVASKTAGTTRFVTSSKPVTATKPAVSAKPSASAKPTHSTRPGISMRTTGGKTPLAAVGSVMHVVIIGGSFSGLSVAVTLARDPPRHDIAITLVEPKAYLEIRWETIRAMFDETVAQNCLVSLSKIIAGLPKPVHHVRARAIAIGIDRVELDDGLSLPFDVLLMATGAVNKFSVLTPHMAPGATSDAAEDDAMAARRKQLRETGEAILSADSILVIGGGPIGTELAAEAASYAQRRGRKLQITLVDARDNLVPTHPRSVGSKLEKRLTALGVDVILGERVTQLNDGTWRADRTSRILSPEVVLLANGIAPSAPDLFGDNKAAVRDGWVRTDAFGRVLDTRGNIFAAGDCCDWKTKSGENTLSNRNVYAHNIRVSVDAFATMKPLAAIDGRLRRVSTERNLSIVTSGPRGGVAALSVGSISLPLPWMKNRTMFLDKAKKEIGW